MHKLGLPGRDYHNGTVRSNHEEMVGLQLHLQNQVNMAEEAEINAYEQMESLRKVCFVRLYDVTF